MIKLKILTGVFEITGFSKTMCVVVCVCILYVHVVRVCIFVCVSCGCSAIVGR